MEFYARLFARRRALLWVLVASLSALAALGLSRLAFDDVPRGIFAGDNTEHLRLEQLYQDFGADDNDVVVVLEAPDWFTREGVELLRWIDAELGQLQGVSDVLSLADVPVFEPGRLPTPLLPPDGASPAERSAARQRAATHPIVAGRILSDDARTTLVVARLAGDAISVTEIAPLLDAMRSITRQVPKRLGNDARARLTGIPTIRVDIYETIRFEQLLFFALSTAVCLGMAWFLFRNVSAILIAALPPVVGALWAMGFVGLIGSRIDIMSMLLPSLVLLIGFTDSVHLVIDMKSSRRTGTTPAAASAQAIRHVGLPCALTSLTTAVGFGSLAIGNVPIIQRFGFLSAAGVILTFIAVITTLPLFGSLARNLEPRTKRPAQRAHPPRSAAFFARLIELVLARPRRIAVTGLIVTCLFALMSLRLVPENKLSEALPSSSESFQALRHVEQVFGGILPLYAVVEWSQELELESEPVWGALTDVGRLFEQDHSLTRPLSIVNIAQMLPADAPAPSVWLKLLPPGMAAALVREDLRRAVVVAHMPDGGSDVMLPLFERLEAQVERVAERHPGTLVYLTGTDIVARQHVNRMIADLLRSLAVASLVIFAVIALEFRSLELGLASLLPNLLPLVSVGALLYVLDRPLQLISAVVFTVLLGLAVDDTIHFLARYRRERAAGHPDAIRRSYHAVGHAILFTTLVLASGSAVVGFAAAPVSRTFALLITLGLCAALVGDLILLPALLRWRELRRAEG